MLVIVTLLSADYPIFESSLSTKSRIRELKAQLDSTSDHLAIAKLFQEWQVLDWSDPSEAKTECQLRGIIYKSMERTRQLCTLHAGLLKGSKLISKDEDINDSFASSNKFSLFNELVLSILLSGLGRIMVQQDLPRNRNLSVRTIDGCPVLISGDSVFFKAHKLLSPFLTYYKSISSSLRRLVTVHEASSLTPLSVALFLPGDITLKSMPGLEGGKSVLSIEGQKPINILVDKREGEQILELRQVIWNVLEYLVENEGDPKNLNDYEIISQFRDNLLLALANILNEQAENVKATEGDSR